MGLGSLGEKQILVFDDSGLEASLNFLRDRSDQNLERLASAPGNRLAYAHYSWSSYGAKMSISEFWSEQLSSVSWSQEFEREIRSIQTHLLKQKRPKWLNEVLRYLPRRHFFKTTIYINLGYDHIVFGEDVALNLGFQRFNVDERESIYYLIHELAHAGYVRYHPLPELWGIKTNRELLSKFKNLTHLEGMGVLSAFRLRIAENGLFDNDYKVLLNEEERTRRVSQYFSLLTKLENNLDGNVGEPAISQLFEIMSAKETRLWYIAGCHMAQRIENHSGIETLRKLVKQGSEAFFNTYSEIADN